MGAATGGGTQSSPIAGSRLGLGRTIFVRGRLVLSRRGSPVPTASISRAGVFQLHPSTVVAQGLNSEGFFRQGLARGEITKGGRQDTKTHRRPSTIISRAFWASMRSKVERFLPDPHAEEARQRGDSQEHDSIWFMGRRILLVAPSLQKFQEVSTIRFGENRAWRWVAKSRFRQWMGRRSKAPYCRQRTQS